ncbi:uncharacterized protein HD556DRAFT_784951 [Suillus plorans]|uniref:F-box domain-containing protein n=1 Tax=Suillus plorans TaxID=116603 RepID=A0A9P7AH56_9AGAM|nr:uncharacterized protein HD556DRAFT_784951 [Suillus plorans]KAG1789451.1 hypothetical protein HD556DRAFT_784951 [Suillus plorans]
MTSPKRLHLHLMKRPKYEDAQGSESLLVETQDTKPSRSRARKGGLSLLPTISLDVLFEIFGFLKPLDLLNLARTSKAFRNLLMRKSNAFIWRASRSLIPNLPECPPDLSEPQYACLAFDPHCYNCRGIGFNIIWQFRAKYCGPCLRIHINMEPAYSKPVVTQLCPNLTELLPTYIFRDLRLRFTEMIQTSQYEALSLRLNGLDCAEQTLVIEETKKAVRAIREIREGRKQIIKEWLETEGWKPEIDYHTWWKISKHRAIKDSRPLTARIWSRIRPILTEYMSEMRTIRMEETLYNSRRRILLQAWNDFLAEPASFPNTDVDVLPHVADVARFKLFDDIIKLPAHVVVERDTFLPAFVALPNLVRNWRRQVDQQLAAIITNGYPKEYAPVGDIRQLATSVFVCNACEQLFFWIDAVAHNCSLDFPRGSSRERNDSFKEQVARIAYYSLGSSPWSPKFRSSTVLAIHVIRSCCQDPRTATLAHMDSTSTPFYCFACHPDGKTVMHWRKGLEHNHLHNNQASEGSKSRLQSQLLSGKPPRTYRCLLCRRSVGAGRLLRSIACHIEEQHGIGILSIHEGIHYVKEIDSIPDPVTLSWNSGPVVATWSEQNSYL